MPIAALQIRSTVKSEQTLELCLAEVQVPDPATDEVVGQVEAAPVDSAPPT